MNRRHQRLQSIFWVLACGPIAAGQPAGTFTATGSMTTPRFGHTATLLDDGRVLIAGGCVDGTAFWPGNVVTAGAELYDPVTGTFTPTGSMTTPRCYHTATLLPDGRVLIASGHQDSSDNNLASAELYDPSTGVFTPTGSMTTPGGHDTNTATLLSDGRVLITGCCTRAELYDPAAGTFTQTGNMTAPPPYATATRLVDGRVLLAAAFFPSELYDPLTGVFAITGAGAGPGPSTSLGNGNVLTTGGWNDDPGPSARAELYDASTGAFTTTGTMNALRANHTATLLPDGNVLISGGSSGISLTTTSGTGMSFYCCVASAELYDSNSGVFAEIPSMSTARGGHTATLLNSGDVLIAGGGMATAEVYHPELPIAAPDLFTLSSDGQCQGAIWHANSGALASATNPAVAGEILSMYTNNLIDGGLIPPQVVVGGWLAEIPYFGPAPGYRGYYQVNFRVPIGVSPGSAVPVRLNYLNRTSNEVSISVQ